MLLDRRGLVRATAAAAAAAVAARLGIGEGAALAAPSRPTAGYWGYDEASGRVISNQDLLPIFVKREWGKELPTR